MISLLLADDHAVVADGLAALLKDRFKLLGIVRDGRSLVASAEELCPDVVVTDIAMPLLSGLEAIRQIKAKRPKQRILVLTMHAQLDLAIEVFRAGATGYVLKTSVGEDLFKAIETVWQGKLYVTPSVAADPAALLRDVNKGGAKPQQVLTSRQREVLQLIAEGRTMKEVAAILHMSPRTAETHKYEMMRLLSVQTTADLIQHAIRLKLVIVQESNQGA
jgi:DNA-binding NarL/FixJ family response regulator